MPVVMRTEIGKIMPNSDGAKMDEHLNHMLPNRAATERSIALAGARLADFWSRLPSLPIGPVDDVVQRRSWLSRKDFAQPAPLDELTVEVLDALGRGTLLSQHPRCLGLFNPSPTLPGVIGELLAAGLNAQLAVHSHAPLPVEMEEHLVRAIACRVGYGDAAGHFTSGGAEANMTAALLALTAGNPAHSERGTAAWRLPPRILTSRDSHLAWFKIAHQLGIGRDAIDLVDTDGTGRMDPAALGRRLAELEGVATPALVVATAGTTNAGMIDPIEKVAAVSRRHGAWLHVDAAWGGALGFSDHHRSKLAGLQLADSVTFDAHKWPSVPMGAGMIITQHPAVLAEAFRVTASYMPPGDASIDPYTHSTQWSRRFMGLKLFMSLGTLGWAGYASHIERTMRNAAWLARDLRHSGWRILNDPEQSGVVCFADPAGRDTGLIVRHIQAGQRFWLSQASFEGCTVLRACPTSFRTSPDDLDALVEALADARAAVTSSSGGM